MGLFVRRHRAVTVPAPGLTERAALPIAAPATDEVPERIGIDEMRAMQARGEPVVIVDARARRNYDADTITAAGAVRLDPDDPVRDATALRLSQRATLVVYCA